MSQHTTVFGSHSLKSNVVFQLVSSNTIVSNPNEIISNLITHPDIVFHNFTPVGSVVPGSGSGSGSGLVPGPIPDTNVINVIQHVVPVIHKKYKSLHLKEKAKETGLNPFVAKQLLDLAILRKEICPITAEEFSTAGAAVMPCGHLFMRFAIEESFKKEQNKCPWCRQQGIPTFI